MKVCPRCGRTEKEVPFIGFFCRDCYLELHPPLEIGDMVLKVCPTCGRVFTGRWTEFDLAKVARWVEGRVKVSPEVEAPVLTVTLGREDSKGMDFWVVLRGSIGGTPFEYRAQGRLEKVYEQCPYCARKAGGYYEAVLQIRGEGWEKAYREVIDLLARERDPRAFITKEVTRKKGVDIFLGSKKVAEKLARYLRKRYSAAVKISHELVTERDGKPITREFVSVRLGGQ